MNERYKETAVLLLIVAAAFALRLWHLESFGWWADGKLHLIGMRLFNSSPLHFSDSDSYTIMARDILEGRGLNIPFNPPTVTFMLTAIYRHFGFDYLAAKTVYAALGALALFPLHYIAREAFGKSEALLSTLLCAASFTLIFITGGLNIENVYLFAVAVAVGLFTALYRSEEGSATLALFFGLAAGAAALTRSEFVVITAGLFLVGLLRPEWGLARKAKVALVAAVGLALALAPWAVRNYRYMTELNHANPGLDLPVFVPVALNGPFNFVEGHSPFANGTYAPALAGDLKDGYLAELKPENPRHLAMLRNGYYYGWDYMKNHPDHELRNLPVKIRVYAEGFANGFGLKNFPAGLEGGSESMADSFVPDSRGMLWIGLLLFAAGAITVFSRVERDPFVLTPFLPLAAILMVSVVFYGLSRLVYPALPFFYMFVSAGFLSLIRVLNVPLPNRYTIAALGAVFLLGFGYWQSRERTVLYKENRGGYGKFHLSPISK